MNKWIQLGAGVVVGAVVGSIVLWAGGIALVLIILAIMGIVGAVVNWDNTPTYSPKNPGMAVFTNTSVKVFSHRSPWGKSYRVEMNGDVYTQSADGSLWHKNRNVFVSSMFMQSRLAREIRRAERDGTVIKEEDWTFASIIPDSPLKQEAVAEWETKMIGYHRDRP